MEWVFRQVPGVLDVECGYSGGTTERPTYEQVCGGNTGHAEVVQITYDPAVVSFVNLLDVFFVIHDPTTLNRQGNDQGTQYRSAIYVADEAQRAEAETTRAAYNERLRAAGYPPITTEIAAVRDFWYAEEYHQQYLDKNPNGYCGIGGTGVSCR